MKPAAAKALVPPRPNPGPEPWSDDTAISPWLVGALIVAAGLSIIWPTLRLLGRRGKKSSPQPRSDRPQDDSTPRGQLVARSHSLREALARHFDETWRAKTIEELASEPELAAVLANDELRDLIRFLEEVDQIKFAPERFDQQLEMLASRLRSWEPRIAELKSKISSQGVKPPGGNPVAKIDLN